MPTCQLCHQSAATNSRTLGVCLQCIRKNPVQALEMTEKVHAQRRAELTWYHDPLPTNCVGDWVCAGGTGAGYPQYAYCPQAEYGYKNLAFFTENTL